MRLLNWTCFAWLTILPMISCTQEEVIGEEGTYAVDFVCGDLKSRSDIHTTTEDLKNGFVLYAHNSSNPNAAVPTIAGSFTRTVSYTSGNWSYENKMYWIPGYTYQFRGYYPADAMTITDEAYKTYEIIYENEEQKDIIMASAEKSHAAAKADGYKAVPLTFNHLLAKLNINLKVDAQTSQVGGQSITSPKIGVIVKGVGISGIAQKAKYTNNAWSEHYGTTSVGRNFDTPILVGESQYVEIGGSGYVKLDNATGEKMFADEQELLVIPQALTAGAATLQMYVDIITPPIKNANEEYEYEVLMQNQPLVCNIPAITWESHKKYVYTVTVTQDFEIRFDLTPTQDNPTIVPWEDKVMSGTIIIK